MPTQRVVIIVVVIVVKIQIFEVAGASSHLLNGEAVGHLTLVPGRRGVDGHGGVATTVAAQAIIYVWSPIS